MDYYFSYKGVGSQQITLDDTEQQTVANLKRKMMEKMKWNDVDVLIICHGNNLADNQLLTSLPERERTSVMHVVTRKKEKVAEKNQKISASDNDLLSQLASDGQDEKMNDEEKKVQALKHVTEYLYSDKFNVEDAKKMKEEIIKESQPGGTLSYLRLERHTAYGLFGIGEPSYKDSKKFNAIMEAFDLMINPSVDKVKLKSPTKNSDY